MSTPAAGPDAGAAAILSPAALEFVQDLNRRLGPRRDEVLARRVLRRDEAGRTGSLDFLPGTAGIRDADWVVPPAPRSPGPSSGSGSTVQCRFRTVSR